MAAPSPWSEVADIQAKVRRRWVDGSLLRAHAAGEPFPPQEVSLRRPRASEIGDQLGAVQDWTARLEAGQRGGRHYTLTYDSVGGRLIGRNELPARAVVGDYPQAWALLGVDEDVRKLDRILEVVATEQVLHGWATAHPLRALQVGEDWAGVVQAYRWLLDSRGSGRYLREVDAPGVDTKFIDQHLWLLARLLDVPATAAGFLAAMGLRRRPDTVRLRPHPALALLGGFSDAVLRVDELSSIDVRVRRALIVENEISFLSVPVPADGVVLWGKGFEVDRAGALPWLRAAQVSYWGDIDTHGFAILHQLRAWLPQVRSVLMDRATLVEHRGRWGQEPRPTVAHLGRLTPDEAALYDDLVSDRFGERLRLEQERVDWGWVLERLPIGSD